MDELLRVIAPDVGGYVSGPLLVAALVGLGLAIGVLTGLFGVGGGFLLNPLMIVLLGIHESVVVGTSLCFMVGTGAAGVSRHLRSRNVEPRSTLLIGVGAVVGTVLGAQVHTSLKAEMSPHDFKITILVLYLVLLVGTAYLVYRGPGGDSKRGSLLQRLPVGPRVNLPAVGLTSVSLPGLMVVGLPIGIVSGLLGIGGGVLFMPLLLLVVGLTAHQAVGTSLGVVLFNGVIGTIEHGRAENVSLWVAMTLLVGSSVGVQAGAWINDRLHAHRLRRWFALVVLLAALLVAGDLIRQLSA